MLGLVNDNELAKYIPQQFRDDMLEPLPPLSEVIPSREEIINFSLDNPVEEYEDVDSTPNARGGKNKAISELTAERKLQ